MSALTPCAQSLAEGAKQNSIREGPNFLSNAEDEDRCIRRFFIWDWARSGDPGARLTRIQTALQAAGLADLREVHGREWEELASFVSESALHELAETLVRYDLGFIVRAHWGGYTPPPDAEEWRHPPFLHRLRSLPIQQAEFPVGVYSWLESAGFGTVGDVVACTEEELLATLGARRVLLSRLEQELLHKGLRRLGRPETERPLCLHLLRPISDLSVSPRAAYVLNEAGISHIANLVASSWSQLKYTLRLNTNSISEIRKALENWNLELGAVLPWWQRELLAELRSVYSTEMAHRPFLAESGHNRSLVPDCLERELALVLAQSKRPEKVRSAALLWGWNGEEPHTLVSLAAEVGITKQGVAQGVARLRRQIQKRSKVSLPYLDKAIRYIGERSPALAEDVEKGFVTAGISSKPFRVEGVLNAAEALGREADFIIRANGPTRLIMRIAQAPLLRKLESAARRRCARCGWIKLTDLLKRFGISLPADIARKYVDALDDSVWLDTRQNCFVFRDAPNQMALRVRRVLTFAPDITTAELADAVCSGQQAEDSRLPASLMAEFCRQMVGCEIESNFVHSIGGLREEIPESYARIVDVLRENGSRAHYSTIVKILTPEGWTESRVFALLRRSGIFIRLGKGYYGLRGPTALA